jgi:GST-like protein
MAGQTHHFLQYAPKLEPPQDLPYAKDRYRAETARLYGVMDRRLGGHRYLAGDNYTIADMASYGWASLWERQEQTLDDKPHLARWLGELASRPAVQRGMALGKERRKANIADDREAAKMLFRR